LGSPTTDTKLQIKPKQIIMPNKSIPTIGDPNWGTPLNAHLSQLQNPTNGGINTFEQFSGRPTTLTLDDAGKTYIYTQTGNLHQWTGNSWKVLNESVINVKDYGAIGDNSTDNTPFIQPILDSSFGRTIYFPSGSYLLNLEFKVRSNNLLGQGNKCTNLKSFIPGGYALTLSSNDFWKSFVISDLTFAGNTIADGGIQFGKPNSLDTNASAITTGLYLKNVDFLGLDICINKRYGNIGNNYEGCSFYTSNYHFVAKNAPNDFMHAGIDTFYKCHFFGASKASIYFDTPDGATGQTTFRDCTFESNAGFCIFSKGYTAGNAPFNPVLKLENVWWEYNGLEKAIRDNSGITTANIFGTDYPLTVMHLEKTNMLMDNTSILDFTLLETTLKIKNPIMGENTDKIIKDDKSLVVADGIRAYASSNKGYYAQDILCGSRDAGFNGNLNCTFDTKPRTKISKSNANLLFAESFANKSIYQFEGDPLGYTDTKSVNDGVLFDNCSELVLKPGIGYYGPTYTTIPKDKYIYWSINTKNFTGNCRVEISNPANTDFKLANSLNNSKANTWNSYSGITNTFNPGGQPFPISLVMTNGNSTPLNVRFSALQILLFDSNEECIKYSDSLVYSVANIPKQLYQESIPTSGTWIKGDIAYNTNPTPGGYVGWICTVSGTPGTWKGFGLIEN
jgi:Pectate lyase superfamily protein